MRFGGISERSWWYLGITVVVAFLAGFVVWWAAQETVLQNVALTAAQPVVVKRSTASPNITTQVLVTGRQNVWDMAFVPSGDMLFTERRGTVSVMAPDRSIRQIASVADIYATGEGGLMGLAVDPKFAENRYVYTCFNARKSGKLDVRVARWRLKEDTSALESRTDIITGLDANPNGRHSGCRMAFGPDGYLWIGTGDAAIGGTAQDPKKLSGKILRVDRDGKGAKGNIGGQFDPRIYSYGHRNVQGIAFFATPQGDVPGLSAEHGSIVDDELNPLKPGNFGWAPASGGYIELGVPMTDLARFPQAVSAIWSSGSPTQAPSGIAIIHGSRWRAWDGAVAMAMLKDKHLKIVQMDPNLKITKEEKILLGSGRIRAVVQGLDSSLYVSTDNDQNDQIIRITPG